MTIQNTITVPAKTEELDRINDFLEELLEKISCPFNMILSVQLAAEEVFVNIANYAYAPGEGTAQISAEVSDDPKYIDITFKDCGIHYDPLKREDPDTTLPAEEREIGGLGIYLVKQTMDHVSYEWANGYNILTVRKYIG